MELLQQLRKIPFLRIVIPYLAGLATGFYCFPPHSIFIFLTGFIILAIPFIILGTGKPVRFCNTWIVGMLLFFMFFIMGTGNILGWKYAKDHYKINASEFQTGRMIIMDVPDINADNVRAVAKIQHLWGHEQQKWLKTKVVLTFPLDIRSKVLAPGDVVLLHARFLPVPGPSNPGEFDYRNYLSRQDIDYQVFVSDNAWKVTDHDTQKLKILALRCRENLLNCFRTSRIEPRTIAVLSALTLGYKTDLGAETTALFTRAGVVHVMALSGFNVGLIFLLVNFCLGFLRNRKTFVLFRLLISLAAIWTFAVITGLSSSVTRASVMISLFLAGKYINRDVHPLNVLSASAFLMLVLSPLSFMDVGFQLSFIAVLGLIYIQPKLYRLITIKYWLPDKIWMLFTASVAAQLATTPLTLYYFHQFPLFFWITNLYVVPLVSLIIYLSVPFLLFSFMEQVKAIMANILEFLVNTLLLPLERLGNIPGALVEGISVSRFQVLLLFVMLIMAGKFIFQRRVACGLATMSILLAFLITNCFHLYAVNRQHYLMVNCIKGASILNIISGRNNTMLCFSDKPPQEKVLRYSFHNWWIKRGVYRKAEIIMASRLKTATNESFSVQPDILGNNVFLCFSGIRFVICNDDTFEHYGSHSKIKMDYVIITNNIKPAIKKLLDHFDIGTIIIDSSVNYYTSKKWASLCKINNINCWPVREKGAFVLKLQ